MSNKNRLTTQEFVKRSNDIHGNEYDYSLSKYINSGTKVSIICKKHGVFKQTPLGHMMNGNGCQKCGYEISGDKNRLTTEDFILKSIRIHGEVYDYSLVDYQDSETDVKIICPSHGLFKQNRGKCWVGLGAFGNLKIGFVTFGMFPDDLITYLVRDLCYLPCFMASW